MYGFASKTDLPANNFQEKGYGSDGKCGWWRRGELRPPLANTPVPLILTILLLWLSAIAILKLLALTRASITTSEIIRPSSRWDLSSLVMRRNVTGCFNWFNMEMPAEASRNNGVRWTRAYMRIYMSYPRQLV